MKAKRGKRILSYLLILVMALTMFPLMQANTADEANGAGIQDNTATATVYKTKVAFGGDTWWVIGDSSSGVKSQYSNGITLLAEGLNDDWENEAFRLGSATSQDGYSQYQWSSTYYTYTYYFKNNPSGLGKWTEPDEYRGSELQQDMEKIATNFIPTKESAEINPINVNTGVAGVAASGQKVWALSLDEFNTIKDDGATSVLAYGNSGEFYWLRSPYVTSSGYKTGRNAVIVSANGSSTYSEPIEYAATHDMRPALNLKLSNVLFTSSASSATGKATASAGGAFVSASAPTGTIKYTFKDDMNQKVTVGDTTITKDNNGKYAYSIPYSDATTGSNQYVSCVLKNSSGKTVYYGKLADCSTSASGTITLGSTQLANVSDGTYTLGIFSEEANGELNSDFASTPKTQTIVVKNHQPNAVSVTYKANTAQGGKGDDVVKYYTYGSSPKALDNDSTTTGDDETHFTNTNTGTHDFSGWNTLEQPTKEDEGRSYTAGHELHTSDATKEGLTADLTLYAQWENETEYTFTYMTNGGSDVVDENGDKVTDDSGNPNSEKFKQNHVVDLSKRTTLRDGLVFTGWYEDEDLTKYVSEQAIEAEGDTTLYAGWAYKVTFNPNEGTMTIPNDPTATDNGDGTYSILTSEGKTVTEPKDPTRDGYIFEGWYTEKEGGTKWDFSNDTPSAEMTLYAHWKAVGTIKITSDPSKTYDGKPVSNPSVNTNSDGVVSFTYYAGSEVKNSKKLFSYAAGKALNSGELLTAPSKVGTYTVVASVTETENYSAATSDPVTFTISAASDTSGGDKSGSTGKAKVSKTATTANTAKTSDMSDVNLWAVLAIMAMTGMSLAAAGIRRRNASRR